MLGFILLTCIVVTFYLYALIGKGEEGDSGDSGGWGDVDDD